MPGINDAPEQVEPLLVAAREAGVHSINGIALHLRGEVRQVFMGWLREARPELVERYGSFTGGAPTPLPRARTPRRPRPRQRARPALADGA